MHIFFKSPWRYRGGAAIATALAALLIQASPLSANDDDKADIVESAPALLQEQEREGAGYYDKKARAAQDRADATDRDDAIYYEKQAKRAKKLAEQEKRDAAE